MSCFFQKSENDLVFEEDHESVRNLIITGKSSNHRRGKDSNSHRASESSNRFRWDEDTGTRESSTSKRLLHPHSQPLALSKPATSTIGKNPKDSSTLGLASPYQLSNVGRKRAVADTDDEDLINSGDDVGSGDRIPGGDYAATTGASVGPFEPGRGDSSLKPRMNQENMSCHSIFNLKNKHLKKPNACFSSTGYYRVTLTIGKSWSPSLETRTSSAFNVYKLDLEKEIQQVMTLVAEDIQVVNFM